MDRKIYPSFEDLLKNNKSIFKFLKQNRQRGLFKAVWDARQGEIDALVQNAAQLQEHNKALAAELKSRQNSENQLEQTLAFQEKNLVQLEQQHSQLQAQSEALKEQLKSSQSYHQSLESALKVLQVRCRGEERARQDLQQKLDTTRDNLALSERQAAILKEKLQEQNTLYQGVLDALKKKQAAMRTQRRLNGQMSAELLQAGEQIEKLRSDSNASSPHSQEF